MKGSIILAILFAFALGACSAPPKAPPTVAPIASTPGSPLATTTLAPLSPPTAAPIEPGTISYPVVDTGQGKCYDNRTAITCPAEGEAFYGNDAQYTGNQPRYQDNGDGTVSDLVTGLMWQQDPGAKMTYEQALASAPTFNLAGYTDWRLPSIKELYSLILFDGMDVSGCSGSCDAKPFIDTRYFKFSYGDTSAGERSIDSQFATSTKYVSTTMNGAETMFGVNFADGRIKGYPTRKTFFGLYVRGNPDYGQNHFVDNGDGSVSDEATGLTWMGSDSGSGMNWEAALSYCENLSLAGAADWRLPDAKELQSLLDYSRSPATDHSAAIDPAFEVTAITDEAGMSDYPFYWSSTTHLDASGRGTEAAYVAFGEALGYMANLGGWVDVHGAGAQRSDPKSGQASEYPQGHGPQGDAIRVDNYVRCVRAGKVTATPEGGPEAGRPTMNVQSSGIRQNQPPGGNQGGGTPPVEAIQACSASTQGVACTFTTPNGTISGTCESIQGELACVPANQP